MLREILNGLAPDIMRLFQKRSTTYTVGASDVVMGELKHGRSYHSCEVYLAQQVFLADFPRALAVFLHEHAHIFGPDGDRGFTDALTELLETVVLHRKELDSHEARWIAACHEVQAERDPAQSSNGEGCLDGQLATMGEGDLRILLRRLPHMTLKRLLNERDGQLVPA